MAAYAALVSLMNDLDDIQNHPRHSFSFDSNQITSLSKIVNFLIDFLESNDHSHGRSIEALESRVTSAARAAHDVIDSHVVSQIQSGSSLAEKLPRTYFLLDLQKAIDNMDFVWRKAMQFKNKSKSGLYKAYPASAASTSGKSNMVGFDAVRDQLMDMMTGQPSGHRQVIPLVGMGGIGKTTLAKNAYEYLYAKQHFDVRYWATISQQFSAETILKQLCASCGEELHKKLWGRRYLIVLDDMWSLEAWDEIQMFMPDNGNGSCVIVTTRLSNLAAHLNSSPFRMNFLGEDKSWELFCGVAFGQEKCPLEFEKIGKKIVKRCGGLPLSITVTGADLRKSNRAVEYWEKVASLMSPISSSVDDEQCLKIISLSYHHLPVHLKPCFLYMGTYAEDERIKASEVVNFWIVEGFVKPKESLSLEEVAEECLKDLIERNLISVRERNWWDNGETYYGIHDIVRELCLKLGKKEKFMCALAARAKKHAIIMQRPEWKHCKLVGDLTIKLLLARSRVGCGECYYYRGRLWIDFRFMRCKFQLPNLCHFEFDLRGIIGSSFTHLSSISLLWNVKTLIIHHYSDLSVPYEIWEMPQLRHLEFSTICLPNPLPNREECIVLQNLHTLLGVKDLMITEEVCRRMPNIKNFSLFYHHFPGDLEAACSYYCPHNLSRFSKLESLKFSITGDYSKWDGFVRSFTFPSSLLKLIYYSGLHWDDLTMMMNSLHHLEVLELYNVKGSEWNLVMEFPRLKTLRISFCEDLIYWNADSSHIPLLEMLHIWETTKLSEIPYDFGEIPTLERIIFSSCSVAAAISAMRIVAEQESFGNQDLQLFVRFRIFEDEVRFKKMVKKEGLSSKSLHYV